MWEILWVHWWVDGSGFDKQINKPTNRPNQLYCQEPRFQSSGEWKLHRVESSVRWMANRSEEFPEIFNLKSLFAVPIQLHQIDFNLSAAEWKCSIN